MIARYIERNALRAFKAAADLGFEVPEGGAQPIGKTMGTDDFYEGKGRLDGALKPRYTEAEKMAFLRRAHEGVNARAPNTSI